MLFPELLLHVSRGHSSVTSFFSLNKSFLCLFSLQEESQQAQTMNLTVLNVLFIN